MTQTDQPETDQAAAAAPTDDPFGPLDAVGQAALVRSGEASARQLTEAAIARIERTNPQLNAVIWTRFEAALADADALDADPDAKAARPFAGAPFLVKDLSELADAPISYGSRLFRDFRARTSEAAVQAAIDAGLIPLGKTNTPEFGLISVTEPLAHGPTRNPWRLDLSPGGSSGGAAAAVAAGLTPVAQCGDGGGSIRIPAAACGLFGLKPSRGRGLPPKRGGPGGLSVTFCVTRTVRDAAQYLASLDAARATADPSSSPPALGLVDQPIGRRLRIALAPLTVLGDPPEPAVAAALADAARLCESLGHTVEEAAPPIDGQEAVRRFLALWAAIPADIVKRYPLVRAAAAGWRVWRWERMERALDPWTRGLAAWFRDREAEEPGQIAKAAAYFDEASAAYETFFERFDVLMTPVMRRAFVPIGEQAPTQPFDALLNSVVDNVGYTPVQNAIGAPAMSVPLGWTADGLPIGVQFAAPRDDEATLLALAFELEAAQPWAHRRPPVSAL